MTEDRNVKELREGEWQALARLLADEDLRVLNLLEEQFRGMGAHGLQFLETTAKEGEPASRRGARQILQVIREGESTQAFHRFCAHCGSHFDLEAACWLLAKTRYPELDEGAYHARLDQMGRELRERLTGRETPRATIEVCNHYLFRILGFRGNDQDYYDPDNSYLHRVLDRRLGIPITLSVVYLLVAKRLNLPLHGVNLPGHFLLKWQTEGVQFFIDPFHQGQLRQEEDCRRMCEQLAMGFHPAYLAAATPRQVLLRMCRNLQAIYKESDAVRAGKLQRFISLLAGE